MSKASIVRIGVFAGAALLLLLSAWWFTRAPAVAAVQVTSAPLLRTIQFSGRVATRSRVDIGATITARVAAVAVREGESVAAGATLLTLDDAEPRAALAQARASVAQAQARLAGLRGGSRDAATAGVAQAQAQWLAAQADVRRTRELLAQGFISAARLDEAQRALSVAAAQRDAAQAQQQGLQTGGSDLAQASAQLALAQAAVEAAQARLQETVVRAPTDARVLLRSVEPGQIVQPGRALFSLALAGPLEIVAQVDERFLDELEPGQSAAVLADAFATQGFVARLARIAPRVDAQRGAIELHFDVPKPPAFLREDMSLSIEVTTGQRSSTRVLPLAALRGGTASDSTVWMVQGGKVQARPVTLGLRTLQQVEVLQGLDDGDVVLVGESPAPGQYVRVVLNGSSAPKTAASSDAGAALSNAMGR